MSHKPPAKKPGFSDVAHGADFDPGADCAFMVCARSGDVFLRLPNGLYRFSADDFVKFSQGATRICKRLSEDGLLEPAEGGTVMLARGDA